MVNPWPWLSFMPSAGTLLDKTKTRGTDRSVGTAFSPSSQAGPTQDELAAICAVVVRPGAKLVRVTSTNDGVPTGMTVADVIGNAIESNLQSHQSS